MVKATIVLARGYEPSEELKKELQTYVKKNTAPYKYPRIVEFVDELPKTISGKIRRVQIRNEDNKKKQLMTEFAAGNTCGDSFRGLYGVLHLSVADIRRR